jgi:hypothetical protein
MHLKKKQFSNKHTKPTTEYSCKTDNKCTAKTHGQILTMSFSSALLVCFASTYSCRFRMVTLRFNYQYSYKNMQLKVGVSALSSLHSWAKMENGWLPSSLSRPHWIFCYIFRDLDVSWFLPLIFNILITILLTFYSFVIDVYVNVWYFHNVLENGQKILKISKKSRLKWKMICKIWKKIKLNSEKIWKIRKNIVEK